MVRVSVKCYLVPFLDQVGAELGTNDYTEVVNHLLREMKRGSASTQQLMQVHPEPPNSEDDALADNLLGCMSAQM